MLYGQDKATAEDLKYNILKMFENVSKENQQIFFQQDINSIIDEFNINCLINEKIKEEGLFDNYEIPDFPISEKQYLEEMIRDITKYAINVSNPLFAGHMTSALPHYMHILSELVVIMNQNVVKTETSNSLTNCEKQVVGMIHRLVYAFSADFYQRYLHNTKTSLGMITSGGTVANITAMWCARNKLLGPSEGFLGVESAGIKKSLKFYGYEDVVILGSKNMHYSFRKAAALIGIGEENLIEIKDNAKGQMDIEYLNNYIRKCKTQKIGIVALVGVAGSTDSGRMEPLTELAKMARREKIHFHVDAAWGGPLVFSKKHQHLIAGINYADTVTIDGHKQLYVPMGCGMILFKSPAMPKAIIKTAAYIIRRDSADLGRFSLEGSRPAVALFLHSAFHLLGKKGYEILINHGIEMAQYAATVMASLNNIELIEKPTINIVNYHYIPDFLQKKWRKGLLTHEDHITINEFNKQIQILQKAQGISFVSRTEIHTIKYPKEDSILVLRMVIANPLTKKEHIDEILKEQQNYATMIRLHN